jgi:hypothetical protein
MSGSKSRKIQRTTHTDDVDDYYDDINDFMDYNIDNNVSTPTILSKKTDKTSVGDEIALNKSITHDNNYGGLLINELLSVLNPKLDIINSKLVQNDDKLIDLNSFIKNNFMELSEELKKSQEQRFKDLENSLRDNHQLFNTNLNVEKVNNFTHEIIKMVDETTQTTQTHMTETIIVDENKIKSFNDVSSNTEPNGEVLALTIKYYYYQALSLIDPIKRHRTFKGNFDKISKRKEVNVEFIDYDVIENLNELLKTLTKDHPLFKYRAAYATGDGNCLYRTFSFLESGDVRNFSLLKSKLLFILTNEMELRKFINFYFAEVSEYVKHLYFPDDNTNDQNITSLPNQIEVVVEHLLKTDEYADNVTLLVLIESYRTKTRIIVWCHNNDIETHIDPLLDNPKFPIRHMYFNGGSYKSQTGHFLPLYKIAEDEVPEVKESI